jgi:DNA replication and repair protein RecF
MHIRRIELTEFRSYHRLALDIPSEGLVLIGENATGKSSLLEAIRMLSTLRSPRSSHDRDVINWDSGSELGVAPYARVVGEAESLGESLSIELGLQRQDDSGGLLRKQIKVNQQPRRLIDAVGTLQTVLFTPEDLDLVIGSPLLRRRFMDLLIGQIDRQYVRALSSFGKVVEQRNSLLKSFTKGGMSRQSAFEQLSFWDDQLVEHGSYVVARRRQAMLELDEGVTRRSSSFSRAAGYAVRYVPSLGADFLEASRAGDDLVRMAAVARREFESQVRIRRDDELRRGMTLVGPHRDDLEFLLDDRSLATFGSRGQQRLAVVALKLAEADVISTSRNERPVLLLDDVLSELDPGHRAALLAASIGSGAQVVLTTADRATVTGSLLDNLPHVNVVPGTAEANRE